MNIEIKQVGRKKSLWQFPGETHHLNKAYLKDAIGDEYKKWIPQRAVCLNCPTGSGKSTFVEDVLITYAISLNKKIIIVSNRSSLDLAFKIRIMEKYGIKNIWNDIGLHEQVKFGEYIYCCTYQRLPRLMKEPEFSKNVKYIIFDEAHYFCADSDFSTTPGLLLKKIPEVFSNAIRIYMSATIDDAFPYIRKSECNPHSVNRYALIKQVTPYVYPIDSTDDPYQYNHIIEEYLYASTIPDLISYTMPATYEHLTISFFDNFDPLISKINLSNEKYLIFVNTKKEGAELLNKLANSVFMDSSSKNEEGGIFKNIIQNEKFECKVLITTSVFINGNNINDPDLNNIIVCNINECDIKQAIGRKRINPNNPSKVNVFLKIPSIKDLKNYIHRNEEILNVGRIAAADNTYLSNAILHENHHCIEAIRQISYVDKAGIIRICSHSLQKKLNDKIHFSNLIKLLESGSESYCKEVLSYFKKSFNENEKIISLTTKESILKLLEKFVKSSPMTKTEFLEASKELTTTRKSLKLTCDNENLGNNRNPPMEKATNKIFEQLNIPFEVIKNTDGSFTFCEKT